MFTKQYVLTSDRARLSMMYSIATNKAVTGAEEQIHIIN
jgi:hypothetical protein